MLIALFATCAFASPPEDAVAGEHWRQSQNPPTITARREHAPLPAATPGPDVRVYGYLAYWANDLQTVPWDQLSDIAIFSASVDASGNLSTTSNWSQTADAVAIARTYGVRVHLCVTNFDTDELETLLGSDTAKNRLIDALVEWVDDTGADGVNIDFEGLPYSRKAQMVQFTADLDDAVEDVVLATPAVDWSGAWDYSELSLHADLFIMGYGYHWGSGETAGPVDPLYGEDPWSEKSLAWTIDDYLANDAHPERVILGLPLYGYAWPVASNVVPASATGTGSAIFWDDAQVSADDYGERWDDPSSTPYYYGGGKQGWYGNTNSLRERIAYSVDAEIGGVGFWALNYDGGDAEMWEMVGEETVFSGPDDPEDTDEPEDTDDTEIPADADFEANAGEPFLAYIGDTVRLSADGSVFPDDVDPVYQWVQTAGPTVQLSDDHSDHPEFVVRESGVHTFQLRVGDGERFSAPDYSYVTVTNKGKGGCSHVNAAWIAAVGGLLLRRRRA